MKLVITEDDQKRIDQAKKIVDEKRNYYTDKVLESIRQSVRDNTSFLSAIDVEIEMYKTIYFYWAYGCSVSEYYFLNLAEKSHEDIKEYVTVREKVVYRNKLNRIEDAHLLNNKWETYNLFKEYYNREVFLLTGKEDYQRFSEFVSRHSQFVVKPTDMGGGTGVHKLSIEKDSSDDEIKRIFEGLLLEKEMNQTLYSRGKEHSLVLEELIVQASEMSAFHPNSVNAVRVTTVKVGDKVNIVYPWIKIGRNGAFLTSAVYGTMDACIDSETGVVNTLAYTEKNEVFEKHPDTGVSIIGYKIPKWNELIALVKTLANKLTNIRYVGWDMVLTKEGWILMEANFSGDFMWQMCLRRGTKKEFEKMINFHLAKDFWWQE